MNLAIFCNVSAVELAFVGYADFDMFTRFSEIDTVSETDGDVGTNEIQDNVNLRLMVRN